MRSDRALLRPAHYDAMFALRDALTTLPPAPSLPSPLLGEPQAPISYLHNIIVMLKPRPAPAARQTRAWRR